MLSVMPTLFDIIAYVETKHNYRLMRFEPLVYDRISQRQTLNDNEILALIQKIHTCSLGTAHMLYSTSFGAAQEMGFNLWGPHGSTMDVVSFLESPDEQMRVFNAFVAMDQIAYAPAQLYAPAERLRFALKYNGAASYANLILDAMNHLGVKA